MINSAIMSIKNNPMLYMYLKYHSYWYKELLRNPSAIREMIEEMKREYKMTTKDRLENLTERINLVNNMLEIFG